MRTRTALLTAILMTAAVLSSVSCSSRRSRKAAPEMAVNDSIPALGFWIEDYRDIDGEISQGETFSKLMEKFGIGAARSYQLAEVSEPVFNVTKIIAGKTYTAYCDSVTNELKYLVYRLDRIKSVIFRCDDSLNVYTYSKPVTVSKKYTDVSISSSLWNDMQAAGSSPLVILKLSDIFAWTIDFFGLRENDRFRVIYQQTECEGEIMSVDSVYFACYSRGDKDLYAVMFDQGDGGNIYWNEKGESLKKAFLKAPLDFKRISSGFSYHRKHPVTGVVKPHTAVDYAAPTGTPVRTIGDGTVLSVGWAGGGGNTVKIRHNSTYTTSYMHLSKYASGIKAGAHVTQGQVIGYVGMTGTATGPHLDFRVYKNGTAINPLTMDSPSADPIQEKNLPALKAAFEGYVAKMERLSGSKQSQSEE